MTTYSNISPDAYQIGEHWARDGSQSLCADCMFMPPRLGVFCSVGGQIVPTILSVRNTCLKS